MNLTIIATRGFDVNSLSVVVVLVAFLSDNPPNYPRIPLCIDYLLLKGEEGRNNR